MTKPLLTPTANRPSRLALPPRRALVQHNPLQQQCCNYLSAVHTQYIQQWCQQLQLQARSMHTVSAYVRDVSQLLHYLQSMDLSIQALNFELMSQFVAHRVEQFGLVNSSVQREVSAIKRFCLFLLAQGVWQHSPISHFKLKRQARPLPQVADSGVLSQLLDQPAPTDASEALLWQRDKAMLELLYSSGLRVSELVGVDIADLDFSNRLLRVTGKGNKTRIVPVGTQALLAIQVWLTLRSQWNPPTEALFVSQRGGRITTRTVERRLTVHVQRAGIDRPMHPHLMRHCFASHMLGASQDLRAVQELLGHANISTTQIYTHVDYQQLDKVYQSAHPRAKKKPN